MLFDSYGRMVVIMTLDFSLSDTRYVRRDIDDSLTKNYDWSGVAGSTFRIKNGKIQIKNDTDGLWYTSGIKTIDGIPTEYLSDTGEA